MKMLFITSQKQNMTRIYRGLKRLQCTVEAYPKHIEVIRKNEECAHELMNHLKETSPDLVISNLFDGVLATITHILQIKYAVYCMDSPVFEIYRWEETHFDNIFFFFFDKREYERLKAEGCANIYHMPLAANVLTTDQIETTKEEMSKYKCDISFVGSLYSRNTYNQCAETFPAQLKEVLSFIFEQSALQWDGIDRIMPLLTPEFVALLRSVIPTIENHSKKLMNDMEHIKFSFLGRKLTNIERTLLLELLADNYDFRLYTWDAEDVPDNIPRFPQVDFSESINVFRSTKINLNITLRSIESGVPLRVFDIMGAGGFVLSNWQPEIPELFEDGKEIVTFKTPEEMLEKVDYYLNHEEERLKIAVNGYRKVKECYTFEHQLMKIISILYPSP